ncbi:MAG: DUF4846 domain-containing protein [Candidatus Aminicenantales bacterium]
MAQALILACSPRGNLASQAGGSSSFIRPEGKTIADRFMPPAGFTRLPAEADSFAAFLRNLPLMPAGTRIRYFDGGEKDPDGVYEAVVDLSLGRRDLQQCADAVIRLRAEYLYARQRYGQIRFNFVSDGRPHRYLDFVGGDLSYAAFLRYLDTVFDSANTASLAAELVPVGDIQQMQAGDVFIRSGRPYGHAVIIVDLAVNPADGRQLFLLAQSYMPAQDIQILKNPNDPALSPWYLADFEGSLVTPEWIFEKTDLRRF